MILRTCVTLVFASLWTQPALPENRVLLELQNAGDEGRVLARYGLTRRSQAGSAVVASTTDGIPVRELVETIRKDSLIREVEADRPLQLTEAEPGALTVPDAGILAAFAADRTLLPFYGGFVRQGYLQQIASTLLEREAARLGYGGGTGIVAVIDTGIDPTHPALSPALTPGYDFIADQPGLASDWSDLGTLTQSTVALLDGQGLPAILNSSASAFLSQSTVALLDGRTFGAFGHGTMVAGLIHLVAPAAKLMPLRTFRADGSSRISDIVRAIYYAADHGATVINMSFSIAEPSLELRNALSYAASKNVICVASAGNTGKRAIVYPAAYSQVLSVGSTNNADRRSSFSNYGSSCSRTAAPGEALITLFPGNSYAAVWGTSFSAALVSGGVAMMKQLRPRIELGTILDAIEHGKKLEGQDMGDARIDLLRAMQYLAASR